MSVASEVFLCGLWKINLLIAIHLDTTFLPLERNKAESERSEKVLSVSRTELPDGQVIKPILNSSGVDRYIVKGSTTKVIGNSPAMPLHRLLA